MSRLLDSSGPILIVEAEAGVRSLLRLIVGTVAPNANCTEVTDAAAFALALGEQPPQVAIVSREQGWTDGLGIVAVLRRRFPDCAVVLLGAAEPDVLEPDALPDVQLTPSARGLSRLGPAVLRAVERRQAARAARGQFAGIDQLPVAFLSLDMDERIVRLNTASLELFADFATETIQLLTQGEPHNGIDKTLIGRPFSDLVRLEGTRLSAIRAGEPELGTLVGNQSRAGNVRCLVFCRARASDERSSGYDLVVMPQVHDDAARSERAPEEDSGFLLAVAHDLRQPMLTVIQSANILRERLKRMSVLRPEDERALDRIVSGCDRVQDMVEKLFDYLAGERRPLHREWVDTSELLDEVLRQAASAIEQTQAQVLRRDMPVVFGDRAELFQLFQNLVENALKYHGGRPPVLHVQGTESAMDWQLVFSDRGIGIDPSEAERIFEPFRRLHSADDYPGTGIGLGVCRQICARHGGRIWAVANTGGGVTFHVQLPKRTPAGDAARIQAAEYRHPAART